MKRGARLCEEHLISVLEFRGMVLFLDNEGMLGSCLEEAEMYDSVSDLCKSSEWMALAETAYRAHEECSRSLILLKELTENLKKKELADHCRRFRQQENRDVEGEIDYDSN